MLKFSRLRKQHSLFRKRESFAFEKSPQISSRVQKLIKECSLTYIRPNRIFCLESSGSKSRAYARMWGLARIWQDTLGTSPAYILEVTHKFLKLDSSKQDKVLLHELAHIPKNFSGALLGHNGLVKRVKQMSEKRSKK